MQWNMRPDREGLNIFTDVIIDDLYKLCNGSEYDCGSVYAKCG